jgi:hypothetical protein
MSFAAASSSSCARASTKIRKSVVRSNERHRRRNGDLHHVVEIEAERHPARGHDADDLEALAADVEDRSQRVLVREELLLDLRADDADARAAIELASGRKRPMAIVMRRIGSISDVVPMTLISRRRSPCAAKAVPSRIGAAAAHARERRTKASMSASVRSCGAWLKIGASPSVSVLPGRTMSRFEPRDILSLVMYPACAFRPGS